MTTDSMYKSRIDTLVERIHANIREGVPPGKIPYPEYNIEDTIYYWLLDDGSARISLEMEPPGKVDWPLFYIYNNELIKVRYRYLSDVSGNRKVYESITYLDHGQVVYCEERGLDLKEGEYPGSLRQLPHEPCQRTVEAVKADYTGTWKKILPLIRMQDSRANAIVD